MGEEWGTTLLDIANFDPPSFLFLSLIAGGYATKWWEGDSVLLATFSFTVSDTMTVCIDTFFYGGMIPLEFARYDATGYVPRHNFPLCMTVQLNPFMRGDANGDGVIDIADITYLINYLFVNGPPPPALRAGDANCDGVINVVDVIYLINYLFANGPPPSCY